MTTTRTRITAAGLTVALSVLGPAAAFAQTDERVATQQERPSADIESLKDRAEAAIQRRLLTIDRLQFAARSNVHITDSHQATLLRELDAAAAGLTALGREIEDAETVEQLRELIPKIAEDYRIYVLMVPKVYEVLGSDTVADVAGRFDIAAEELEEAIDRADAAGYDVAEAREHLAEMIRYAGEAESLGVPVAAAVLPLLPADWPDPAKDVLERGRRDLSDARQALRHARESAHDALEALREAIGGTDADG